MIKKIIILITLFTLSNCAPQGSAFLGPIITGTKTGSLTQASISYGSGKIMTEVRENMSFNFTNINKINVTEIKELEMPIISATNKLYPVYVSEVEIIEPLP